MDDPKYNADRVVDTQKITRYCGRETRGYAGTINTVGNFLFYSIGSYNLYDYPKPKIVVERTGDYIDARY